MSVIDCEVSVSLIVCVVVLVPVHWFYPLTCLCIIHRSVCLCTRGNA
uniref:Uncharacterized protein n=1 Tax=Anguilla anguilla TaxID=7936 RepID=A0A0E9UIS7_ANGAN